VEHLLMIGGPTDVVVEPNIVRATAAPRDGPGARPTAGIDALPRAIPLPENGNGSGWPLAPESTVGLRSSPRLDVLPDELPPRPYQPLPEPPPRPQRDTLAALADELSTRPTPAPPRKPQESRQEPRQEARKPMAPPAPATPATEENPSTADQSLADMAQRLEAVLRKPNEGQPPATPPRPARPEAKPAPRSDLSAEARGAKADAAKPGQGKGDKTALYDSLEQEMASLLGRPTQT
jgi:flagellar protein FliO/FliZ